MLPVSLTVAAVVLFNTGAGIASAADGIRVLGPQGVNLWQLEHGAPKSKVVFQDYQTQDGFRNEDFPVNWFEQPLDHFDDGITDTFQQRYWVNTRHYKPGTGGPVIVLDGGETSGEVRPSSAGHPRTEFSEPTPILGHWHRRNPGACDWWPWCCPRAPLLWCVLTDCVNFWLTFVKESQLP